MKLGAADFVSQPFDVQDLEVPLVNALKQRQLSCEIASMRDQLQAQSGQQMLFGNSEPMAEVWELIERVADTDVTVLIRGESGTGKELVARALCHAVPRPAAPVGPAAMAAAAAEAGHDSLKDISRTAAREAERELILEMLQQTRWNRKKTAEILGISDKALLYKIKEGGLDKAS